MQTNYTTQELLHDEMPVQRTSTINVLTILTFIGCALGYLGAIWTLTGAKDPKEQAEQIEEAREKVGDGFMGRWLDSSMDMAQKSYDYRYVMLGATLLFTTLCLIGALKMREMKKEGFPLYAVGEIAPIFLTFALFGVNLATGVTVGFSAVIALVFVLLYAGQRKYMR